MESWRKIFRERHTLEYLQKADQKAFEELIVRFKEQHPELMILNPEVGIAHISQDEDGSPLNLNFLTLGHPYIFDYRLLPDRFENFEVQSIMMEQMPSEFPEDIWIDVQSEVYYSPERYEHFVNRNIDSIRKGLKSNKLTKSEALDALTGGFEKHKAWAQNLKKERTIEHKDHISFFNKLLKKTEVAFYKSDVYKKHGAEDWGYSVTATSFKKNEIVIVGFNWGVDKSLKEKGETHGSQTEYPVVNFASNYEDLGSFKRTVKFFYRHFDSLPQVQTNYCFFRSETESQISSYDRDICGELFDELIEYLEPSKLITFSRALNTYLKQKGRLNSEDRIVESGKIHFPVTKGTIEILGKSIPYYNLPHPNYPIRRESREEAWEICFGAPKY